MVTKQNMGDPCPCCGASGFYHQHPPIFAPEPSPRYLPVNMPIPRWSGYVTVAVLDMECGVTIYTDANNPYEKQDIEKD